MDYTDKYVKRAAGVVQSFMTISRTLVKFTQQNADSLGLTVTQMGILNTIRTSPGITLKEITERLFSPKSTISISVDSLVNLGLVARKSSEEDRREVNLKLTREGEEVSKKSCENAVSYRAMLSALEKLSEEDVQSLLRIHRELSMHLQKFQF